MQKFKSVKKLHKLVIKSYIGPLLVTFSISMFVLLMQFIWKYVDDLVGKGLELSVIAKFLYYAALTLVPMALPLAILLASLMTFGNLGERYELVAMKAAGISLTKIMRPLVIISLVISMIAFFFSNNAMPYAYFKYRTLLYDIQTKKPALNIQAKEFYSGIDGYVIRIGEKNRDGSELKNVQIYDHTDDMGNNRMTFAKKGSMHTTKDQQYLVFNLEDGYNFAEDLSKPEYELSRPLTRGHFDKQIIRFDLSAFSMEHSDGALFKNHYRGLNTKQLKGEVDTNTTKLLQRVDEVALVFMSRYYYLSQYYQDSLRNTALTGAWITPDKDAYQVALYATQNILTDLKYYQSDINSQKERISTYKVEWYNKYRLAIACLVLFFIGAPLGAIIRRGGLGVPVVMSVVLFIIYHVISMIGEISAKKGSFAPWEGVWLATAIFLPVGIFLTYKAAVDAPIMDADVWRKYLKKIFNKK